MGKRKQRHCTDGDRRALLKTAAAFATGFILPPASAAVKPARELAFYDLHTGESLRTVYWEAGRYLPDALKTIDFILRDYRTGEVKAIDPALLDLLWGLRERLGNGKAYHVISGYRSRRTNAYLRTRSGGVAKYSLHMVGKAVDIRLPGTATRELKQAAVTLKRGGVGYYPQSDFIHVDTGRVRYW